MKGTMQPILDKVLVDSSKFKLAVSSNMKSSWWRVSLEIPSMNVKFVGSAKTRKQAKSKLEEEIIYWYELLDTWNRNRNLDMGVTKEVYEYLKRYTEIKKNGNSR